MSGMHPFMMSLYILPLGYLVKEGSVDLSKCSSGWIECGGGLLGVGTDWKSLLDREGRFLYRGKIL